MTSKWTRKLDKELNNVYSEAQQELINWYPDNEDDESYEWVFKVDMNRPEKHRWILNKKTGEVVKKFL